MEVVAALLFLCPKSVLSVAWIKLPLHLDTDSVISIFRSSDREITLEKRVHARGLTLLVGQFDILQGRLLGPLDNLTTTDHRSSSYHSISVVEHRANRNWKQTVLCLCLISPVSVYLRPFPQDLISSLSYWCICILCGPMTS